MTKNITKLLVSISILIAGSTVITPVYAEADLIPLSQVTEDISYLASDDLKGRHNYSPEIHIAASYIAKRFQESGLINADELSASNYLQKYQVTRTLPQQLNITINGKNISPDKAAMASTVVNFTWHVKPSNNKPNIEIHNISANDDMRAKVSELNLQGGEHLVLLDPAHKDKFERYQKHFQRGTAKLIHDQANKVSGGVIVLVLTEITPEQITHLDITGISSISESELANVVAILPGKTKPEEVVLFSAHYDHLGVKDESNGNIYNGADDNASGTTAIINLAQHYAKQGNNARTLMFTAFSAEEIGGFGSSYFSKQLDPQTITAMINIEMIGKPSKFGAGTVWMTGIERSTLGEELNHILEKSGKKIYKDPYPEQGLFYRSDNATLARLGVPAHSFSSVQLTEDQHYHQTSDDLSSLNLPSLRQVIKTLALATQPIVDGHITPSRIDKNLVKSKGLIY